MRAGFFYRLPQWLKLAFTGTMVGAQNGAAAFAIPAYTVWDLSAEGSIWKDTIGLTAGFNNVFGARYYARVIAGEGGAGIDPAGGRTFYVGVTGKLQ